MPVKKTFGHKYLGLLKYRDASIIQESLHKSIFTGELGMDGFRLFLCPEPVITLGKYCSEDGLLVDKERLEKNGIQIYRSTRGGDITCHEPGQLVVYPIINLKKLNLGVKEYVNKLEEVVINFLNGFGVSGFTVSGKPGVWTEKGKIASVGINIKKFVTTHGIAVNISNSLDTFRFVNPCGYPEVSMSSVEKITGEAPDLEYCYQEMLANINRVFGVSSIECELSPEFSVTRNYISPSA